MVSLATEPFCVIKSRVFVVRCQKYCQYFCVIYYGTDPGGYFLLVFLRCEDETILPGFRGKVGGLLHRSRENATFSAIIPEFCSVFRGVLQSLTSQKNKRKGLD